ncbi:unnamed protein product [Pleuronectes platessa]|uniref:ATR-interacting protein n=1 Tax=Pleuronectes platessa TaxID=8262 RepID=A0A9N7TLX7_PLEPL|nr:unnamed protein product [Pleuronectes platessa]
MTPGDIITIGVINWEILTGLETRGVSPSCSTERETSMNCPPTKRLRSINHEVPTAFDDPFGDDEDFTQDDLDEIDVLASQAFSSASAGAELGSKAENKPVESAWPSCTGKNKPLSRATSKPSRENTFGFGSSSSSSSSHRGNAGIPSKEPLVNRQQQKFGSDRQETHSQLEAQHADLKRKLKEVEDEIVSKSGEIRVLRDSLKSAHQEKEKQRENHMLQETQRQKEQSDKEKELNKKVQSLRCELQFKEAEINEMKTKLLSSDRNKTASPLTRNSPKVLSSLAQLHHGSGSSSSSPAGNGFITKETFGAQLPTRGTPVKTPLKTRRDGERTASNSRSGDNRHEASRPDPFSSVRPAHLQHQGGVLLGLLLQHPLSPSSLSLSHLLSMSLTDLHSTSSGLSAGLLLHSDAAAAAAAAGVSGVGPIRAALSPVQSLAVTGLNLLSQSPTAAAGGSSRNSRSCPGAVLLLPLLDLHLSRLCQTLDSLHSNLTGGRGSVSAASSSLPAGDAAPTAGLGRHEEAGLSGFSVEDTGLASLRLLYLLLAHSDEVVETVLSKESQSRVTDDKTEPSAAGVGLCSQKALLPSLLRLCETGADAGGDSSSPLKEELVLSAMKTLCVLIERTPKTQTDRLQCVLPVMCACLSADSRLWTVTHCVSVLVSMSDHETLARQLCSQHDPCVFLKLFLYIRIRPDNQSTQKDWILLDLQVVRLLSRLMTQRSESWNTHQHSSCPCYTEVVQTVVIVFHRQECLLLLHWLLLHHRSFSESCQPLLHMYDQVIPAVRDTLKKIPGLSESEELALEEICRSEGDDTDDMETDN